MAAFYPNLDVLTVPQPQRDRVIRLGSGGGEAFRRSRVSIDLPASPTVIQTGMGEIVPTATRGVGQRNPEGSRNPPTYFRPREEIAARFSTERTAADYEALFRRMQAETNGGGS